MASEGEVIAEETPVVVGSTEGEPAQLDEDEDEEDEPSPKRARVSTLSVERRKPTLRVSWADLTDSAEPEGVLRHRRVRRDRSNFLGGSQVCIAEEDIARSRELCAENGQFKTTHVSGAVSGRAAKRCVFKFPCLERFGFVQ